MDREVVFAKTLEQIKKLAGEQGGFIQEEQVRDAFAELSLEEEQLQLVFDYLKKHRIGIGEPVDPEEYLTEEERDFLQGYLEEIEMLSQCSQGEKHAITLSAMAGDISAKKRLMEIYLNDVAQIARLYAGQGVYLEDLIGEGNVALTIGVELLGSLEEPKEAQGMLSSMIMRAMEEFIQENAAQEKMDRRILEKVNLVTEKAKELSQALCRKVTKEELAQETGMSLKSIQDALRMSGFQIEYIENTQP
ncbi:sigma-70 domain-containing protein [Candidatus Acetatifactor stercoripullorum]|uniref:sigma-70 domain-containing protein n=1 Tax=Candidatus Acetatifactor stercoripullorum TaxID=2838414 RepID=UPI00298E1475|nr:sigma-70 domain-containing protein [Candidatus Acetatifactor stercoripullorum]